MASGQSTSANVKPPLRIAVGFVTEARASQRRPGMLQHRPGPRREVILHYMDTADDGQGASWGLATRRPSRSRRGWTCCRGPSSGTVHLPSHLDWSGSAVYDLDAPGRGVDLYRAVLIEAANPQEYSTRTWIRGCCDGCGRCCGFRPSFTAWEQRFPVLAEICRVHRRPRKRRAMEPRHECRNVVEGGVQYHACRVVPGRAGANRYGRRAAHRHQTRRRDTAPRGADMCCNC